jgi:hypothetical protein
VGLEGQPTMPKERLVVEAKSKANNDISIQINLLTYKTNRKIALQLKKSRRGFSKQYNKTIELDEGTIECMMDALLLAREYVRGNIKEL